jgi:pimeloyl-ACP methyl ester carboxylesterase
MTAAQRDEYLRVFAEPGALTAALNWYRALPLSQQSAADAPATVKLPTLFLWGSEDPAVGRSAVERQRGFMEGPYREVELDAGHWLIEERGPQVIEEVLAHWSGQASAPTATPGRSTADPLGVGAN